MCYDTPMTLSEAALGQCVEIIRINNEGSDRRRLLDLGFTPGAHVVLSQVSPLGDPSAYELRGSVIALRRTQSDDIEVKPC